MGDHGIDIDIDMEYAYAICPSMYENKAAQWSKKVIPLELVPSYDREWLDVGVKSKNYYLAIGASGCINKKYMYLNLETGEEIFYEIINDRIELIDDEEYKNRLIDELGKNETEKNKFPQNMLQQDFFYLHNQIYKKIALVGNENKGRDFLWRK